MQPRITAHGIVQLEFLVRAFNHGPGTLFMPDCGHYVERASPNAGWIRVHEVQCPTARFPPVAIHAGGAYGWGLRLAAPADTGVWHTDLLAGRYRTVSYLSAELRPGGAWGRPLALRHRTSPEFQILAVTP